MNTQSVAGPSGTASWTDRQAGTADRPLPILALPDAANSQRTENLYYVLPRVPQLARDSAARPVFSLSLVLSRCPGHEDDSIFPLIQSGSLACDLTLGLPDDLLNDTVLPLFARQAEFRLMKQAGESDETTIAETEGSGAGMRVGLGANLDQVAAQGVLVALQGGTSGLALACRVTYRTAESRLVIHIYGRWAALYDYLHTHMDLSRSFSRTMLQNHLLDMVRKGVLKAWRVEPNGLEKDLGEADAPALLEAFMKVRGTLLRNAAPLLDPVDAEDRYALFTRPDEALTLDMRLGVTLANEASQDLDAPLEAVIGGTLEALDAESYIHLTYFDSNSQGGMRPAPRRMRSGPQARSGPDSGQSVPTGLAAIGENLVSMTRALIPDAALRPSAAMLLSSDAVRPQTAGSDTVAKVKAINLAGSTHAFVVGNLAFGHTINGAEPPGKPQKPHLPHLPHLPVVEDAGGALWVDRADASSFWYPPEISLVPPNPADDPDASPFRFTFRETGHDNVGHPVLEGEALFSLRRGRGAATQAALQSKNNPAAQPVPTIGLSVTLSLPVRDNSGQLHQIDLPAGLDENGDIVTARVALLNEYVHVAYGDLAIAGFQPNPARLKIAYTFQAMVPADQTNLVMYYAGKIAATPVAYSALQADQLAQRPYVDATQISYRSPTADLVFRREPPAFRNVGNSALPEPGAPPPIRDAPTPEGSTWPQPIKATMTSTAVAFRPTAVQPVMGTMAIAHPVAALQPALAAAHSPVDGTPIIPQTERYALQTQVRSAVLTAFFPCNILGAFYRQDLGDRLVSIGCQDSFSLGQTAFKLFELIEDSTLASPLYKVYRSLSQPGSFLVVPAAYRITRYAPGEGERAYRPVIYLYSSLDAQNETNNRCVVMASLQPDLPPWMRKDLEVKLTHLHHSPVLQYITEIDSELTYTWSLSGGSASIQPQAAKLWDSFQVTLSTDLAGGLQLQAMLAHSGVSAGVRFLLADGTAVDTSLLLDLTGLTGPWAGGPLQTDLSGVNATLANRIERRVNLSDLALYGIDGSSQVVRVDRLLAAGESISVDLPFQATEAYPIFAVQPGGPADLVEISSFVEDIHTNVVFVNLINYANHNLKSLDMQARLKEVAGSTAGVAISEAQPVGEALFVMPLTTYLGARTLQFQVTKTDTSGNVTVTTWLEWDLTTHGNVISMTWSLIQ